MGDEKQPEAQGAPCQGCGAQTPYNESHGDHRWPFCGSKVYPGDEYFCAACAHKQASFGDTLRLAEEMGWEDCDDDRFPDEIEASALEFINSKAGVNNGV
jgi:hypothetical protein